MKIKGSLESVYWERRVRENEKRDDIEKGSRDQDRTSFIEMNRIVYGEDGEKTEN